MRRGPRHVGIVVLIAAHASAPAARGAEVRDKLACAASHERTQRLRIAGRLLDARDAALSCTAEACPPIVRADCARLLDEIDAVVPSLVIEADESDGRPTRDAALDLDGERVSREAHGEPLPVAPGEHEVRVVTSDGRTASTRVVASQGDRRKHVTVRLPGRRPPASGALLVEDPRGRGPGDRAIASELSAGPRWLPWTLALGGTLGLGVFTFFGLRGYREQVSLEATCAPRCAASRDDAMRRDYLIADVALVAGVAALATAGYLLLRDRAPTVP